MAIAHPGLRRGFTLFEMMALITIIGIMAGVAIPAVSSIREARQDTGVNELMRVMRAMRTRAMTEGRPHAVLVDSSTGVFEVSLWAVPRTFPEDLGWERITLASGEQSTTSNYTNQFGLVLSSVSISGQFSKSTFMLCFDPDGSLRSRSETTGEIDTTFDPEGKYDGVFYEIKSNGRVLQVTGMNGEVSITK